MTTIFLLWYWLSMQYPAYGDVVATGHSGVYSSEGRARQEAKFNACDLLRSACLDKKKVLNASTTLYGEPVCTSDTDGEQKQVSCEVSARAYCDSVPVPEEEKPTPKKKKKR